MSPSLLVKTVWLPLVIVMSPNTTFAGNIPELPGDPTLDNFPVCYKHTCAVVDQLSLTPAEWQKIRDIFQPNADSPEAERLLIKKAIAQMERLIGEKTGTSDDKGENFAGVFAEGNQMDCIDESSNSTTYLALMQKDNLLQWHQVQPTKTRGFFFFGMPHTTAVIKENQSAQQWAVDSWFYANGVEPVIIPISQWSDGWHPEKIKD